MILIVEVDAAGVLLTNIDERHLRHSFPLALSDLAKVAPFHAVGNSFQRAARSLALLLSEASAIDQVFRVSNTHLGFESGPIHCFRSLLALVSLLAQVNSLLAVVNGEPVAVVDSVLLPRGSSMKSCTNYLFVAVIVVFTTVVAGRDARADVVYRATSPENNYVPLVDYGTPAR